MRKSDYLIKSLVSAGGVFVYVSLVAWLMFNAEMIFDESDSFLIPVFMLLLFVISASITGFLVLGRPIHLYLNNAKKEAFVFLFATLAWLLFFLVAVATVLLLR